MMVKDDENTGVKPCEGERIVLEGVLLPTRWEPAGGVMEISLLTFDERDYPFDPEVGRDSLVQTLVRKHVRLSGIVHDGRVVGVTEISIVGK